MPGIAVCSFLSSRLQNVPNIFSAMFYSDDKDDDNDDESSAYAMRVKMIALLCFLI